MIRIGVRGDTLNNRVTCERAHIGEASKNTFEIRNREAEGMDCYFCSFVFQATENKKGIIAGILTHKALYSGKHFRSPGDEFGGFQNQTQQETKKNLKWVY